MGRILVPTVGSWFDGLSRVSSYNEDIFQNKMLTLIEEIFPGYFTFKFNYSINAVNLPNRKPDLAMLHRDFKEWWLVEVEKSTDSYSHIKSQLEVFSKAEYNSLTFRDIMKVKVFERYNETIDGEKLLNLIDKTQPKVLLILDEYKHKWEQDFKKYATICVLKVYKNTNSEEAFKLSGEYPIIFNEESHCKFMNGLPNIIEIFNPAVLSNINENIQFNIFIGSKISAWVKFSNGKKTYIRFDGSINQLIVGSDYVLKKDLKNNLHFKLN